MNAKSFLILFSIIHLSFCCKVSGQILKLINDNKNKLIELGEIRGKIIVNRNSLPNKSLQNKDRYTLIRGAFDFKNVELVLQKFDSVGINFTDIDSYFNVLNQIKDEKLDFRIFIAFYNYTMAEGDRFPYTAEICLKKFFFCRKFLQLALNSLYERNLFTGYNDEYYEYIDFSTFFFNNDYTQEACNSSIGINFRSDILKNDLKNLEVLKRGYIKTSQQKFSFYNTQVSILNKLQSIDTLVDYSNKIMSAYTTLIEIAPENFNNPYIKRGDFKQYSLQLYNNAISDYFKGITYMKNRDHFEEYSKIADCYYNLNNYVNSKIYYSKSIQMIDSTIKKLVTNKNNKKNQEDTPFEFSQSQIEDLNNKKSKNYFFLGLSYYLTDNDILACKNIIRALELGYEKDKCLSILQEIKCK